MIFSVIGILKSPAAKVAAGISVEINEHLAQPFQKLISAGYLQDQSGERVGVLAILEAESIEKARSYVGSGPFKKQDLYDRLIVAEYVPEVGHLT